MKLDDGIPAIPLWIDGHAWFSVFEEFIDIREADGEVRYRVPKCGDDEVARALLSARDAQPAWSENLVLREKMLADLAVLLDQFGGDFARIIERETGKDFESSRDEVTRTVNMLREASCASGGGGVQAVYSNAVAPLASVVEGMVRAVHGGRHDDCIVRRACPFRAFCLGRTDRSRRVSCRCLLPAAR